MTEDDAIKALQALTREDQELSHLDADNIVVDFLRSNGYPALAGMFETTRDRVGFWYA